jgi:hypothetical protein
MSKTRRHPTTPVRPAASRRGPEQDHTISMPRGRLQCEVASVAVRVGKPNVKHGRLRMPRGPILRPPFTRAPHDRLSRPTDRVRHPPSDQGDGRGRARVRRPQTVPQHRPGRAGRRRPRGGAEDPARSGQRRRRTGAPFAGRDPEILGPAAARRGAPAGRGRRQRGPAHHRLFAGVHRRGPDRDRARRLGRASGRHRRRARRSRATSPRP